MNKLTTNEKQIIANRSYEQILDAITVLTNGVLSGDLRAENVYTIFYKLKKMLPLSMEMIKEEVLDYIERCGKDVPEKGGIKLGAKWSGGQWDYSGIPEIEEAEQHLKDLKEKYKALATAFEKGETIGVDPKTGEVLPLPEKRPQVRTITATKVK